MAIEPSPTAAATRFTLPERTSPTAKTPGRLVSSICGGRARGQTGVSVAASRSRPVRMKPLLSRARQPLSQLVLGGGSRHYEHVADFIGRSLSTSAGTPGDVLQMRIAF